MTHGSLFSGIGGFDLAAEWMGWENVFHCEWNEFGKRVLKYYWPKAISYDDITKTDFNVWRGRVSVLSGGFPCQPYSQAGKRLGKEDDRHLWPEMLRAIREIQPTWVVGENVLGIVNWNGGLVFDEVQADLEAEGYEVQTYVLPAAGVNAPHQRYRTWFVAYNNKHSSRQGLHLGETDRGRFSEHEQKGVFRQEINQRDRRSKVSRNAAYSNNERLEGHGRQRETGSDVQNESGDVTQENSITPNWDSFPTSEPTIRDGNDGIPSELDSITFPKWRNESIKAGGNAVVPQVVLQIFKAIEQYENNT